MQLRWIWTITLVVKPANFKTNALSCCTPSHLSKNLVKTKWGKTFRSTVSKLQGDFRPWSAITTTRCILTISRSAREELRGRHSAEVKAWIITENIRSTGNGQLLVLLQVMNIFTQLLTYASLTTYWDITESPKILLRACLKSTENVLSILRVYWESGMFTESLLRVKCLLRYSWEITE